MLELEDLYYAHPHSPPAGPFNLQLDASSLWVIEGPSGGGKTSLLRLMAGFINPQQGRCRFMGHDYREWEMQALRSQVQYVAQNPALLEASVRHNLTLAFGFAQNSAQPAPDDQILYAWLERFGLQCSLDHRAHKLSVGQQYRLALIRALLLEPKVLLCDEPLAAQDPHSATNLLEALDEVRRARPFALLIVSHQPVVFRHSQPCYMALENHQLTPVVKHD